ARERAVEDGAMNSRFAPGDRVLVRRTESPGHLRTPFYIRGLAGVVERVCGPYANPEELAYGRPGLPARPLSPLPLHHPARALARVRRGRAHGPLAGTGLNHVPSRPGEPPMHDDHDHDHAGEHTHTGPHPKQPDVEDLPSTEPQRLEAAVRTLLIEKGVFTA